MTSPKFAPSDWKRKGIKHPPMEHTTTVVDVTYLCNASCKYCQWGNHRNPRRRHLVLHEILLSAETITALGTERIVLSGGEPRLHPQLPQILAHYKKLVDSVIVLSNGHELDRQDVSRLRRHGATGITVSIDSLQPEESMLIRETPSSIHRRIISNLKAICEQPRKFELGINAVVSHVTANWKTVREILEFGQMLEVDFVKFQPIFDDGYAGRNAPYLLLTPSDSSQLLDIGMHLATIEHPKTNPSGFWNNIADLARGKQLSPSSCGLGPRHSISVRSNLNVCYWLNTVSFGNTVSKLDIEHALTTRKNFESAKLKCKVGFHCFCNQDLSHIWENQRRKGGKT